mgnify:CR=1 FL=1
MKATEKIKLMIDLEFGFQQLDFEELHMIKDTLNKEIEIKSNADINKSILMKKKT